MDGYLKVTEANPCSTAIKPHPPRSSRAPLVDYSLRTLRPMDDDASRKTVGIRHGGVSRSDKTGQLGGDLRKNIATLNSDTILTARFGCLARTFAARSCTHNEIAIRFAMSTSNPKKETSPDSVLDNGCVTRGELPKQPLWRNSLMIDRNVRGSAVMTMDNVSTEAMSSSSDIWASCAASSSSLPMPKDTEKARSEPREPRAEAVSAMAPDNDDEAELIGLHAIEAAVMETHNLPCRLAWQSAVMGGATLVIRRLLVAPRGIKRGDGVGGPMRSKRGRMARDTQHYSSGTVFGCTLGNLVQHSRGCKHSIANVIKCMRRVLAPGGRAAASCSGEDVPHLIRGMACHRVLKAQYSRMREMKRCDAISTRVAHPGVVIGLSAALLIAFEAMAMDPEDAPGLGAQLQACLRDAHAVLEAWRLPDISDSHMAAAHLAERRAIERARVGVARAQIAGQALSSVDSIRLQLDAYRRAVWPPGEKLDEENHGALIERIKSGELVDLERDALIKGAVAPGLASLAALPAVAHTDGANGSGSHSSVSGASSQSSAWSVFSEGDPVLTGDGPVCWPPLHQMALAVQDHVLSPLARAAMAPPVTVSSHLRRPVVDTIR